MSKPGLEEGICRRVEEKLASRGIRACPECGRNLHVALRPGGIATLEMHLQCGAEHRPLDRPVLVQEYHLRSDRWAPTIVASAAFHFRTLWEMKYKKQRGRGEK